MAKKIKYKVGDVFVVPLENGIGYGRILIENRPFIFCEFYYITPSKKYSIEDLRDKKTVLSVWCANHGLNEGKWTVIGNIPIEDKLKVPYLLKVDLLNPKKKYLVPADVFMKDDEENYYIKATQDQIKNAKPQPYGLFGDVAAQERYTIELKNLGDINESMI